MQTAKIAVARSPECRGTGRCRVCRGTGNAAQIYSAGGDCDRCLGYGWCQHSRGSAEDPMGAPADEAPPGDVFAAIRELYGLLPRDVVVTA